jgi:hypothetical protein
MTRFVILAAALLLGATACDSGEWVSPDTSSPTTADAGTSSDGVPADAPTQDVGSDQGNNYAEEDAPSSADYTGVWCPYLEGFLQPSTTMPGGWDCPPVRQMATAEVPVACRFGEE